MINIDWKTKFQQTKISVDENFLKNVEQWWNGKPPLVMQGAMSTGKLAQATAIAENFGLRVVKVCCSPDLTFNDLYGTATDDEFYPGILGEILLKNEDTCLILDNAEEYPPQPQMIGALITFCKDKKIRFGKKIIENKNIALKPVLTTGDIEKLDFLLKPWIYANDSENNQDYGKA